MSLAIVTVALSHIPPVANGGSRWVYVHPQDPKRLIKVLKARIPHGKAKHFKKFYYDLKSRYKVASHLREVKEYIRVINNPDDEFIHHLPAMTGMVNTDRGFGFVFEAIRERDGRLGTPLLRLIVENRVREHHLTLMETFFDRLIRSPVIVGDFNYENIVLGHSEANGDFFALVDGLGAATLIPTRALVPGRNLRKKRQARERFLEAMRAAMSPDQSGDVP